MLSSLLPGIREVRAPLAAGYLWLAVLWICLEPVTPSRAESTGAISSVYRLIDDLSFVGAGIVASFGAYLIGSLSVGALSGRLRSLFAVSLRPGSPGRMSALTPAARSALGQMARTTREQLRDTLALSGTDLDEFLQTYTGTAVKTASFPSMKHLVHGTGGARMRPIAPEGPGRAEPVDPDSGRDAVIAGAVIRDLDVVATTRLLGRDQELYSAVDRSRAEVEFRLAVAPPLLALAIAIGSRTGPLAAAILVPLGFLMAVGLLADALRSQRTANAILIDAVADNRVRSPTLERMHQHASTLAGRRTLEIMEIAARTASVNIGAAIKSFEWVGRSEPKLARHAKEQVDRASASFVQMRSLFPDTVVQRGQLALDDLATLAEAWVGVIEGQGPPGFSTQERLDGSRAHFLGYLTAVRETLDALRSKSASADATVAGATDGGQEGPRSSAPDPSASDA